MIVRRARLVVLEYRKKIRLVSKLGLHVVLSECVCVCARYIQRNPALRFVHRNQL